MGDFARWAGVGMRDAVPTFDALAAETVVIAVEGEERVFLESQCEMLPTVEAPEMVRLLPPGDPHLGGPDRELTVPDETRRSAVWAAVGATGRVAVDGEIVGTWRRRGGHVAVHDADLSDRVTGAVEHEVSTMPLADPTVEWVVTT